MKLFTDPRPRTRRRRPVDAAAKYRVLKAIAQACRRHNVPPLDERLKSIVATQIGNLLRGGWSADEIAHVAIERALMYDRFHQHESMLGLQRVVTIRDDERRLADHQAQRAIDATPVDARVAAILGPVARRDPRRHPNNHRFEDDGTHTSTCTICHGPPGVHVTIANVPELEREVMAQLARARDARRTIRAVGGGTATSHDKANAKGGIGT